VTGQEDGGAARVGISILAYNATATIVDVLERLPERVAGTVPFVLVADDESADDTAEVARAWVASSGRDEIEVVRHPKNLGYGHNQVHTFRWAIEHRLDVVALLHGDAQYPPELVPDLVAPILADETDGCFGSRMLVRGDARRGHMPIERRIGNRLLSTTQNVITGVHLSEWHSGFRAFRVATLAKIDLERVPPAFDVDTAMVLELLDLGARITEIPIPTHYADEISYLNPWTTGLQILGRTLRHRLTRRRVQASG
jgi:glycosyltransferase involved in cell wall biosynthesis